MPPFSERDPLPERVPHRARALSLSFGLQKHLNLPDQIHEDEVVEMGVKQSLSRG